LVVSADLCLLYCRLEEGATEAAAAGKGGPEAAAAREGATEEGATEAGVVKGGGPEGGVAGEGTAAALALSDCQLSTFEATVTVVSELGL
jgi:hypothetical protein